MRIGYIRVDPKMGDAPQREVLLASGIPEAHIYVENNRESPSTLEWIITKKMRPSARDTVEVSDLHRLASNTHSMTLAIERISDRNGVVVEARSGATSIRPGPFARALADSIGVLAGRLGRADRSRIGRLGAEASPVTKSKSGFAPLHLIQEIMSDPSLTVPEAVHKINRHFKLGVSVSTVYRWKRAGKLKFANRVVGARPKPKS